MSLAVISVAALGIAIIVSCVTTINVGVLSIAMAWIIGVYIGGMRVNDVMGGFPTQLFLTLAGVTLRRGGEAERHSLGGRGSGQASHSMVVQIFEQVG